jgi:hypothetical protein
MRDGIIFTWAAAPALPHSIKRGSKSPLHSTAGRPADRSRNFGRCRTSISRGAPQNPSTILIRDLHHSHSPKAPISATKRALVQHAARKISRRHGQISAFGRRISAPRLGPLYTSALLWLLWLKKHRELVTCPLPRGSSIQPVPVPAPTHFRKKVVRCPDTTHQGPRLTSL